MDKLYNQVVLEAGDWKTWWKRFHQQKIALLVSYIAAFKGWGGLHCKAKVSVEVEKKIFLLVSPNKANLYLHSGN